MHSENGSPLSMDSQLCFALHVSAFHAIPDLCCCIYDISSKLFVHSCRNHMVESRSSIRKTHAAVSPHQLIRAQDLGPSVQQMIALFLLLVVNSLTLFMVGITFFRACYALCCNVSTIESWEIERHEQLLRRAKVLGGYLDGPNGSKVRIRRQEFPFDIGILRNIAAGMGSSNPLSWLFPFARTPATAGLSFETNGFEDPGSSWPPPDPDRMPRLQRNDEALEAFDTQHRGLSNDQEIQAFRRRQQDDYNRQHGDISTQRRKPFHVRYGSSASSQFDGSLDHGSISDSGEEGWQDSGGNRLKDYGVDEDVEFYDEDDIPLAELLRKKQDVLRSA